MGDLVRFSRSSASTPSIVSGESAAILFFTGVRYFHADDFILPVPQAEKPRRPSRPRKSRRDVLIELHG